MFFIAYHSFKDITSLNKCPAINFQHGNAFCRQCHLATKKYITSLNLILEIYHFHDTGNFTCLKELSQNMIHYRASNLIFRRKTNFSIRKCENLSRVVCLKDNPFIAFGPMLRYFIVMRGDSLSLSNLVECWKQIQMNVDIPLISSCPLSTHNNFHMDIPQPWNPSGVWRNGINRKNVKTKGAWSQEMKVMTQWTRVSEQYII